MYLFSNLQDPSWNTDQEVYFMRESMRFINLRGEINITILFWDYKFCINREFLHPWVSISLVSFYDDNK